MADNGAMIVSPADRDIMIRTVMGEAGNDASAPGVAAVIANRMRQSGQSASQVVLAPGQFEPWSTRRGELLGYSPDSQPYQAASQIVDGILSGKTPDPTNGATRFYAPAAQRALGRPPPSWDNGSGITLGAQKFFGGQTSGPSAYAAGQNKGAPASAGIDDALAGFEIAPAKGAATPQSDPLAGFEIAPPQKGATSPSPAAPSGGGMSIQETPLNIPGSDPLAGFNVAPSNQNLARPAVAAGKAITTPIGANDVVRAASSGVPIVGGLLNRADAATNATLAPVLNQFFDPKNQLQGGSWGERYNNALSMQNNMDTQFQQQHPIANTALHVVGGIAGTIPAMMAAPEAFGIGTGSLLTRSLVSGATGAGISAADTAIRGGDLSDVGRSALVGGALGGVAPGVGDLVGGAISKIGNALTRTSPGTQNVASLMHAAGLTPIQAESELARLGPYGTLSDVSPALTNEAIGLAKVGGSPTDILKKAMLARSATRDDRISQAVNETLGPAPDAQRILSEIQDRRAAGTPNAATAASALDNIIGHVTDPHTELMNTIKERSAATAPLYRKALSRPVQWSPRLQQFLDDPIVKSGIPKGVNIQRMESLASGERFDPNDYAIKMDKDGNPSLGATPNFRTLNVVKKGLDAMVQDAKDPVTGRLSEEGRALDMVRSAFLKHLDDINPDYKAARMAWAGPSSAIDAYNRGLNIFANRAGSSGIDTTPGAFKAWLKTASDGDWEAGQIGARAAFHQQMSTAADPAAKAAAIASKGANQEKLSALLGDDEASELTRQLTYKYEDPEGQAFDKGMNIFRNRGGIEGIEDTPQALKKWMGSAPEAQVTLHREGARQAIEQALTSARQGDFSAARSLFAKSTANRQKLDQVFPQSGKLFDTIDNEIAMKDAENKIAHGSMTADAAAVAQRYKPGGGGANALSLGDVAGPVAAGAIGGAPFEAGALAARTLYGHYSNAATQAAANRLASGTARVLSTADPGRDAMMKELSRAFFSQPKIHGISTGGSALTNAAIRGGGNSLQDYIYKHGRALMGESPAQEP